MFCLMAPSSIGSIRSSDPARVPPGQTRAPGRRKKIQDEILEGGTSTPPPAPATTQPTTPPTPIRPSGDVRSLASRYVSQYEAQSGRSLSEDERTARVSEVESFYSSSSRGGRLEKIVFA